SAKTPITLTCPAAGRKQAEGAEVPRSGRFTKPAACNRHCRGVEEDRSWKPGSSWLIVSRAMLRRPSELSDIRHRRRLFPTRGSAGGRRLGEPSLSQVVG